MGRAFQNRKESMAKTSDQKAKVYSKYGREIYVCAKSGGVDPNGNLALRSMIDRAKKDQVPTHVIDKALDKAKGGGGEDFDTARYEGYGPGSTMVIVDCLSDNPNRTFGDVRTCFNKVKAKIGTQGSVSHMFDHSAIFSFSGDEEAVLEALMEADVDVTDIENEDGKITVFAPHTDYGKAKSALMESFDGIELDVDEIQFVPQNTIEIEGETVEQFERFLDLLNDLDDVQNVYHNAEY
ncbi:YebC/PmpR family DNA-binding transcriptional regulator [Marinomonas sp. 15G1-11]|uniref:Probable transcriptional regulatory protein O1D97_02345 n=1 Tax=Marinomonas phaeophyticola TaxID=3004091 RepID=A0ABT4JQ81_9GAMM|nr:YebC/PmpR family DNA-binding transcriptional regulator [Marinomonas sp. 15G1-11]MCZ2720515.1 YebC/PmpR family DNA-binding transcriptional regulator [Marinomonas sp. 15G1-11]